MLLSTSNAAMLSPETNLFNHKGNICEHGLLIINFLQFFPYQLAKCPVASDKTHFTLENTSKARKQYLSTMDTTPKQINVIFFQLKLIW